MIDYYDQFLNASLGRAVPYIEHAIAQIINWRIILYPHAKHIFVLQFLFFSSGAMADYRTGRPISAAPRILLGFVVALVTAVTAGAIPLAQNDFWANFGIVAIPLFSTSINNLAIRAMRWYFFRAYEAQRLNQPAWQFWSYFKVAFYGIVFYRIPFGLAVIYLGLETSFIRHLASPGLALLGILVVLFALDQIVLGSMELKSLRKNGEAWYDTALRSRGILIGLGIFGVFIYAGMAVVAQVGWQILGLP